MLVAVFNALATSLQFPFIIHPWFYNLPKTLFFFLPTRHPFQEYFFLTVDILVYPLAHSPCLNFLRNAINKPLELLSHLILAGDSSNKPQNVWDWCNIPEQDLSLEQTRIWGSSPMQGLSQHHAKPREWRSWLQRYKTCTLHHSTAGLGAPSTVLSPHRGQKQLEMGWAPLLTPMWAGRKSTMRAILV